MTTTLSAIVFFHIAFQSLLLAGLVAMIFTGISFFRNVNTYLRAKAGELNARANYTCSENSREHDRHSTKTQHLRSVARNENPCGTERRDLAGACCGGPCQS